MSRILIALELGGGYGHLAVCLSIAEALRARGHTVSFILRDLRLAAERLETAGFSFTQSPVLPKIARWSGSPVSYAEILLAEGYGDAGGLLALVAAWRNAFRLVQPDLILADHAPTALFAARLSNIPCAALGAGFTVPPPCFPMPSILPWKNIPRSRLEQASRTVDLHLTQAAAKLGCTYRSGVAGLFGRHDLLTTFAELDCYGSRPDSRYIGPIHALSETSSVAWPSLAGSRILAYLRPEVPGVSELLAALAKCDAAVLCVMPGAKPEWIKQFSRPGLHIVPQLAAIGGLLTEADLVVTYGGHGFLCQALQAGRPLLVIPQFIEQLLNARCAERLGAAIVIGDDRRQTVFATALARILDDARFAERARAFADRYVNRAPEESLTLAVDGVEALLGSRG